MSRALILVLFFAMTTVHADTIETIEGATAKEKEIRWLWKYLGEAVKACAAHGPECQEPALKPIVDQLAAYFPAQPPSSQSNWGT